MKRLFAFALLIVVTLSTITASASEPNKTVIDLGDGFYMVEATSSMEINPEIYTKILP